MEPIRSTRNQAVVSAGRLHRARDRHREGRTLLEGPNLLAEAIAAGVEVEQTFALEDDPRIGEWPSVSPVVPAVMKKLAGTQTPRGPLAVMRIPDWRPPTDDIDLLVLMDLSDPGNVGTIIRSAAAFGLGVVMGPGSADPWAPKVVRAAAGGHFRIRSLSRIDDPEELGGHRLAATVVSGGREPAALDAGPWAFLIGSEAHGLAPEIVASADARVTLSMEPGSESLNAAVAASILAYVSRMGSKLPDTHR